jgi:hypothetical protein
MQLLAVALARIVAFVELIELDPRGHLHAPDFFAGVAKQFSFQKVPEKYEEYDTQKGIELAHGKWDKTTIDKLMIFGGGLSVDTRSSTDESEKILHEFLKWAASSYGLQYRPEMTKRRGYVSQLVFKTDGPILSLLGEPVAKLSNRVTTSVEDAIGETIHYEPTGLWIGFDQLTRKMAPAAFNVQRRTDAPFHENKYFSEAPLPTQVHLKLLQEFEGDLLTFQKNTKIN